MKRLLILLLMGCSLSCSHLASRPLPPSVEDLHVYENVSYPTSPFDEVVDRVRRNSTQYIEILNGGDEALLARIHLIRVAEKAIYIQTFIWANDETGRLIVKELVEAARRGVKIKIIVDYLTLEKNIDNIAYLATVHPNIEFKIYNPTSQKIKPLVLRKIKGFGLDFLNMNKRMHNKIMVIDDQIGITGGRNIANDYYDRGAARNFKDRDVLVVGPAAKTMTDSFTDYWRFDLSIAAKDMIDVHNLIEQGGHHTIKKNGFHSGELFNDLDQCASDRDCVKRALIDDGFDVSGLIDFIADKPGKNEKIGKYKATAASDSLLTLLVGAEHSIVMQTPYLILQEKWTKIFKRIRRRHPNIDILVSSNSLAAADHVHAYAFSFKNKKKYLKNLKWRVFELRPRPEDADKMVKPFMSVQRTKDYFTCIHAKSYVFDDKIAWIGSFNLDPRSKNLNTEVGLVIHDEKVALALKDNILRDIAPQNSWTIGRQKKPPVISYVSGLIDDVMEIIPLIHIWPFQYTESFTLKEGKEELPFYHENFYDHYDSAGPFPQMELSIEEIQARLLRSFFGVAEGLM